jgi:hypothetical protein
VTADELGLTPEELRECLNRRVEERGLKKRVARSPEAKTRRNLHLDYQRWPWKPGFHVPTLEEFITSPAYLGDPPLTDYQRWALGESVGLTAADWFVKDRSTSVVWLCLGKGSGKDLISSWCLAYAAYTICSMANPWRFFGQPDGEFIDCINMAQDRNAARQNFYDRFTRHVKKPCFATLLNQSSRGDIQATVTTFSKMLPGRDVLAPCVRVHSLNSKNESAEGKNTLFWVLDEADALRDSEGNDAAHACFNTLRTSNRFGSQQMGFVLSWPRSQAGFIFWGLRQCGNRGGQTPEWWGAQAPTWEVLPWKSYEPVTYEGVLHKPDAIMAQVHRDDPDLFWSTYGTQPPSVEGAFISQPEKITEAMRAGHLAMLAPAAKVEQSVTIHRAGEVEHRYVALNLYDILLRPGVTYFLGGDAGTYQDSFTLCLSHAINPEEGGYCCGRCFGYPNRRYAKHYQPRKPPAAGAVVEGAPWQPGDWRCDFCGETPVRERDKFWGVATAQGQTTVEALVRKVDEDGDPEYETDSEGKPIYVTRQRLVIVQDLLLEWRPDKRNKLAVDYGNVRDVIKSLFDAAEAVGATIGGARFDQWQAESIVQEIRSWGVACESKVLTNPEQMAMYRSYKTLLNNNLLWLQPEVKAYPQHTRARNQLKELQLINGRKIDHPSQSAYGGPGQKDLTDAEALSFFQASNAEALMGQVSYIGGGAPAERAMLLAGRKQEAEGKKSSPVNQQRSMVDEALRGRATSRTIIL